MLLDGDQIQLPHNYGDQKPFGCHMQVAIKRFPIAMGEWKSKTFQSPPTCDD
jgi:hypothetical protein